MRAFALDALDSAPRLRDDLAEPRAGDHEIVVRVRASSVNPADAAIAGGMLAGLAEHEFPVTLGRDLAGLVEQRGPRVTRYGVGDWVYGFLLPADPVVRRGTWAELVVVPEDRCVAAKPEGVDLIAAGAAPLAGATALLALDALALEPGDTLLVVGATGGVGSLAAQLAHAAGAHVIATARPEDEAFLRSVGVDELVDREGDVAAGVRAVRPHGVDAVLDVVSWTPEHAGLLRDGGRMASSLGAAGEGAGRTNLMATPDPDLLARLGRLLDDGSLRVPIHRVYRLEDAAEALAALAGEHVHGKIALTVV